MVPFPTSTTSKEDGIKIEKFSIEISAIDSTPFRHSTQQAKTTLSTEIWTLEKIKTSIFLMITI